MKASVFAIGSQTFSRIKTRSCSTLAALLALLVAIASLISPSLASVDPAITESVLHSFGSGDDAFMPQGEMVFDSAGNLYGVSPLGGGKGGGAIFELSPVSGGWTETVIYAFCSVTNCNDGNEPRGGLVFDSNGNIYGTTQYGGTHALGVVFELSPSASGWTEKVLHNFCSAANCADGWLPSSRLIFDSAGNLYGTAPYGGPFGGQRGGGVAFEMTKASNGWKYSVLYSFCKSAQCADGDLPWGGLAFDASGNLYGTTLDGGSGAAKCGSIGCGVVYELSPSAGGWKETVLYSFCSASNCTDGLSPYDSPVLDSRGDLYGTTYAGGNAACQFNHGCGLVFELVPGGGKWTERILYTFTGGSDGGNSYAPLIFDTAGNLSGTTNSGGNPSCSYSLGCGVVFKLSRGSNGRWTESVPYAFAGGSDGANPVSGLTSDSVHLYGLTQSGGNFEAGVAFELQQ